MTNIKDKDKSKKGILFIVLIGLIGVWVLNNIMPNTKIIWYIGTGILGITFSIKNKSNSQGDIIAGILLGILVCFTNPIAGIATTLSYIGAQSVFRKSQNKIKVIHRDTIKNNIVVTLILVVVIGGGLGVFNLLLGMQNMPVQLNHDLKWVILAFQPGISEEIIFRYILFAICVVVTKDKVLTRGESILCYAIMIVPHVLLHFQLGSIDIGSVLVLIMFFGAPFALLQRKWNLMAAIGSHYVVDLIRFFIFAA